MIRIDVLQKLFEDVRNDYKERMVFARCITGSGIEGAVSAIEIALEAIEGMLNVDEDAMTIYCETAIDVFLTAAKEFRVAARVVKGTADIAQEEYEAACADAEVDRV